MSVPPSRAQSDVLSASQYDGTMGRKHYRINYFIVPIFVLEVVALACLWALFYYLRMCIELRCRLNYTDPEKFIQISTTPSKRAHSIVGMYGFEAAHASLQQEEAALKADSVSFESYATIKFTNVFPYHQRVFHCRDASLMKPNFLPNSFFIYVSYETLYCVSFIVPPFVILIGELMFWLFSTKPRKTVYANCREWKVHLFSRRLLRFISVFMFGALIVCIFVDTIKLMTGFQRPYFLTLCNPNFAQYCRTPFEHSPEEHPPSACLFKQDDALRTAWLSFPSLHAALSSYAAIFTSCYVHYMISLRGAPLLRPFLVFGFLGMSLIASFSFVQGYKNHWVDVWVGWLIGTAAAFYLCHNVLCFQEFYHMIEEESQMPQERISPFFSWFRLPRVHTKEPTYSVYAENESPHLVVPATSAQTRARQRAENGRNLHKTYEVTTTTESFQRTISPAGNQNNNAVTNY